MAHIESWKDFSLYVKGFKYALSIWNKGKLPSPILP